MKWIKHFSQFTPRSLLSLSLAPKSIYYKVNEPSQAFYVADAMIQCPNPESIVIKLVNNIETLEVNLHDLMLNRLPHYPYLAKKINNRDAFALKMIWLELGTSGHWKEGQEIARNELINLFQQTADMTHRLLAELQSKTIH
ncbi:MAG: hypothetical protein ACK4PR_04585 [Gammaproteobacteria bacterium]